MAAVSTAGKAYVWRCGPTNEGRVEAALSACISTEQSPTETCALCLLLANVLSPHLMLCPVHVISWRMRGSWFRTCPNCQSPRTQIIELNASLCHHQHSTDVYDCLPCSSGSQGEGGILQIAFDSSDSILLARGSAVKPAFERIKLSKSSKTTQIQLPCLTVRPVPMLFCLL